MKISNKRRKPKRHERRARQILVEEQSNGLSDLMRAWVSATARFSGESTPAKAEPSKVNIRPHPRPDEAFDFRRIM